jgi:hypothetical protein
MPMKGYRARAAKVAIAAIDANRGEYATREDRETLLDDLIQQYSLKDQSKKNTVALVRKKYLDIMNDVVVNYGNGAGTRDQRLHRLFTQGSDAIRQDYREMFQYDPTQETKGESVERGDESESDIATGDADDEWKPPGTAKADPKSVAKGCKLRLKNSRAPAEGALDEPEQSKTVQPQAIGTDDPRTGAVTRKRKAEDAESTATKKKQRRLPMSDIETVSGAGSKRKASEEVQSNQPKKQKIALTADEPTGSHNSSDIGPADKSEKNGAMLASSQAEKVDATKVDAKSAETAMQTGAVAASSKALGKRRASEEIEQPSAKKQKLLKEGTHPELTTQSLEMQDSQEGAAEEDQPETVPTQALEQTNTGTDATDAALDEEDDEIDPERKSYLASGLKVVDGVLISQLAQTTDKAASNISMIIGKDTNMDPKGTPVFVEEPSKILEQIYKQVFGEDWKDVARRLVQLGEINNRELIEALGAGAAFRLAFEQPLPFDGPEELFERLGPFKDAFSEIVEGYSESNASISGN